MAADPSVAQEVYQGWRVCSHHIRRVICPLGQRPVPHHHHQHLKEPSLSREARQGPPSAIPAWLVANFCSSGWRKDLEHILWVCYKYNVDYFTEADWSRIKEQFFDHFLQHKKEALEVKEARLLDFMAYIQDLFYQATGLHLDSLGSFTCWIKKGSYYHRIVAQQGHLQECLHLAGAPLPRWPQVAPSESRWESQ